MKLKMVGAMRLFADVPKDEIPVLMGNACFARLSDKNEQPRDYPQFIRQPAVVLPSVKRLYTAYVSQGIHDQLGSKRDVIIGPYLLYSYFRRQAKRLKTQHNVFVFTTTIDGEIHTELYFFVRSTLERVELKTGFDDNLIAEQLRGDFKDSQVRVYFVGERPTLRGQIQNVTFEGAGPFDSKKGINNLFGGFGLLKTQHVVDAKSSLFHGEFKQCITPAAVALLSVCLVPATAFYKSYSFDSIQSDYRAIAYSQEGLPNQAELTTWTNKALFIQALDKTPLTTAIQSEIMKGLSRTTRDMGLSGQVVFERLDIGLSTPSEVNGKQYNVILEVGLAPNKSLSAEEQSARFAAKLSESMGSRIDGSVDIWDDVVRRNVRGKDFIVARLYLNHLAGKNHATDY